MNVYFGLLENNANFISDLTFLLFDFVIRKYIFIQVCKIYLTFSLYIF